MKEEAKIWIEFADEDLKMAELAFNKKIYNQVCFHSQQCVEKVLKGFLLFKDTLHPQSHKLADILTRVGESPFDALKDDILLLDRFYILTRYPDALPGILSAGLPSEKEATEALNIAKKVFEIGKKEMNL